MTDLKAPTLEVKKASKKEKAEKERRTIRIELKLFEPTKDSFPKFNVPKLLMKELKQYKKEKGESNLPSIPSILEDSVSAGGLPMSDDDNPGDVARLAKKFEEKYGTGSGYDMSDKGAGYDENDSFIDNTEAFDEKLVDDTPHGGFYINSGPLKFDESHANNKKDSTNSGGNGNKDKNPGTKKRSIGSLSSIDSDGPEEVHEKSSKKPNKNKMKKQKRAKEIQEQQKPCKEIAIKDMLRFQRDNLLKTKSDSPKHNRNRIISDDEESDADSIALSQSSNDSDVKIIESSVVSLPSNLPEEILIKIDEFNTISDGKSNDQILLNQQLYHILVDIEGSSKISLDQKINIKTYLNSIVQCQDLYRKVQKERVWENKQSSSSSVPMETGSGINDQQPKTSLPQMNSLPSFD
uniref:CSON011200 protein n=1 Tax=Culicoides sonorensis TaxID=179676 RepID=A0A336LL28_CULSO